MDISSRQGKGKLSGNGRTGPLDWAEDPQQQAVQAVMLDAGPE